MSIEHNILIISDSHGNIRNLHTVLSRQIRKPDVILFLGDGLRDWDRVDTTGISLLAVKGNCDCYRYPEPSEPFERLLTIGNVRICMMHGHTHHVKAGRTSAAAHAAQEGADILLFGHTHAPLEEHLPAGTSLGGGTLTKPLTVFNPGTLGGAWGSDATFGTLTIRGGVPLLTHGKL